MLGSTETGFCGFRGVGWSVSQGLGQGQCFVLDWGQVAECFMQAVVVVPADVGDDRELDLALWVRHTRSRISSVLMVSTKLSASALS